MNQANYNNQQCKLQRYSHIIDNLRQVFSNLFVSTQEERRQENARKIFHVCGGIILSLIVFFIPKKICILFNIIFLIPLLIIDYNNWFSFLNKVPKGNLLTQLLREHECIKGKLTGLSWLLICVLIINALFDKYIASLSILILIIGDASAALIGKNFGRIKICGQKTLEGTVSFIFASIIAFVLFYNIVVPSNIRFHVYFIFASIIISAIVELFSKSINIDDNFSVPLTFCSTYKVLYILFR